MKQRPRPLSENDVRTLERLLRAAGVQVRGIADGGRRVILSREEFLRAQDVISSEMMAKGMSGGELNAYGLELDELLSKLLPYLWATEA